jgi:YgiT-type zinc finger domain-containing protein
MKKISKQTTFNIARYRPMTAKGAKHLICPGCGARMDFGKDVASAVWYKDQMAVVKLSGYWCAQCGEAIFEGESLRHREEALLELKAKVDGPPGAVTMGRKLLCDGTELPARVWYYLLDYLDRVNSGRLRDLNREEAISLFREATQNDLSHI